jgi:hypothetical protein
MGSSSAIVMLGALLCGWAPPGLSDLSKIERSIAKEPTYKAKARYCLLVFGPNADVRVWLVSDGDTLYVDRNANGDLTEPGESLRPTNRRELITMDIETKKPTRYRESKYSVGDLTPAGRSEKHTRMELTQYQFGEAPAEIVLSLFVDGTIKQYAGWHPIFAEDRQRASVVHFGGPMIVQPIRYRSINLSAANPELHVRFGTPGLERTTFASLAYEALPENIHPHAEIEWPRADPNSAPVRTTVIMSERC